MVIDYSILNRNYKDFIQNISTGGVFIETRLNPGAGQNVTMTFPLPNSNNMSKLQEKLSEPTLRALE